VTTGVVVAVCLGTGGIPKHAVESAVAVELGLVGDGHRFKFHGGAHRAVCLFALEDNATVGADGVACDEPGTFGENVLTVGIDYTQLRPGDELAIGDELVIAIHDVREPCGTLKKLDKRFPDLMLGRSGFVCSVVQGGLVRAGMAIEKR
jgi:MOSC domain-containing protein YiiM